MHGCVDRAFLRGAGRREASQRGIEEQVMAGHSQFKNIMHRKGRQDKVKS
jgi:hypothetical protein